MMQSSVWLALLILAGAIWFGAAIGATLLGLRRSAEGARATADARAVADLLGGAPAVPLLVYPDDRIDADPRVAAWLGLAAVPERLEQLGGAAGFAPQNLAVLADAVADSRLTGKPISLRLELADGPRTLAVRGGPYSVAGADRRAILLWLMDVSSAHQELARLREQVARLGRAIDGLSAIIEAAPFPMWHRAPDLALSLVNGAYVRAIEAESAEEVVARGAELVEGGAGPDLQQDAARARDTGEVVARTAAAIVAGERRLMRVVDVPLGDTGVAGYAIDIQELEEARTDLDLFVRAQRDMLDRLSAGVAQFASDRSLVFHNLYFARLFALAPEWLADRPDFDRVLERMREAERLPEVRDFPSWRAERRGWFASGEAVEESWSLPAGIHLRVVAQPLPDRGLLLIFEDRTEHLRLTSARDTLLRVRTATLDNLFEAIGVFAADGRLQLWNTRFGELWHVADDFLVGHPRLDTLLDVLAPRLADPDRALLIRDAVRIATGERHNRSGRISLIDGRHFDFAAVPLPDGNALFTLLDVTAARASEETLRARAEALEEADRLKNAFVASMSYELRVPLTSITGFAEMLAGGYAGELGETARDYVAAIVTAVGRLSAITGDVLDLTQSEAGTLPMEFEPLALMDVVRGSLDRIREAAWSADLTLAADLAPDGGTVSADRRRLAQALDHLLRNAVAYTPAGGRVLTRLRRDGASAEITLSDNGRGISAERQNQLFDRLGRGGLAPAEARQPGASRGFGLPLARQLVEAHGGSLTLVSEEGEGTTVTIRLPLLADAGAA